MATNCTPISTSTSLYREFHVNTVDWQLANGILLDDDGPAIYETEYSGLLLSIIMLNGVATLNRYLLGNVNTIEPLGQERHTGTTLFDPLHTTVALISFAFFLSITLPIILDNGLALGISTPGRPTACRL